MVAVAAVPAVIGADGEGTPVGDPQHIERLAGLGSPRNSATIATYDIAEAGMLGFTIDWYGLSAVKLEVYDVTDGSEVIISSERIRAPKDGSSVNSTPVMVMAGNSYKVVAIPGGGPGKGDYAEMQAVLYPIELLPPVAMFTATTSYLTVDLDGSGSYDPDGMVVAWDWTLGDGGTASGETVTYTYAAAGTYTVTLTVTDNDGLTDTTSQDVTVTEPPVAQTTYTISQMFEYYPKSADYADMGRLSTEMGVPSWWSVREWNYGEIMVRQTYPFVLGWPVWSENTAPDSSATDAGFALSSFYRLQVDANEVSGVGTGPGNDAVFVPMVDATYWGGPTVEERMALDGGTLSFSYYGTYLTDTELYDIKKVGNHYANTYYGVTMRGFPQLQDDGWWHELQGEITMDVAAAQKYLGLAGVDLAAEFTAANGGVTDPASGDVSYEWNMVWATETGSDGIYDIYTAYDYSNDIRYTGLTLDPSSTASTLVLRLYSVSWGNEMLLTRYLEAAGVLTAWQTYNEDFQVDGVITSSSGDIDVNCIALYHMSATKDPAHDGPAWSLESMHIDYCGNVNFHTTYVSPYNPYDPDVHPEVTKISTLPTTANYGNPVNYWYTPMEMDLQAGEVMTIQLPTGTVGGYTPEAGTGVIDDANSHWVSGTLELGTGDVELGSYDAGTKTLTLTGPIDFATHTNPSFPSLLESGTTFNFIVV
jgi:PKD repeat protein